jgi:hypothetical protein
MEIIRKDLLSVLDILKPAVAKKDIIAQQQHVIFMGSYVGTINGQIVISHPFLTPFKTSVKFSDLQKILSASGDEKVDILVEQNKMKIIASDTKASLNTIVDDKDKIEDLLDSLIKSTKEWKSVPEDFSDALYLCAFSASRNQNDGVLTAVSVQGNIVATSDKIRTSLYTMKGPVEPFLISAPDAQELSNLSITHYCIAENWLHFKTENGATFSARKFNGNHLPFEKLFTALISGTPTFNLPSALKDAISVVAIMVDNANDVSQFITLEFKSDGTILCKAERERGSIEKIVPSEYKGPEVLININPSLLYQVLEKSTDMSLHQLKKGEGMIVDTALFKSGEFKHIVILPLVRR